MFARAATILILGVAVVGCAVDDPSAERSASSAEHQMRQPGDSSSPRFRTLSRIAALPDRGSLFSMDGGEPAIRRGASSWYPVEVSEAHALRAAVGGAVTLHSPSGEPIEVRYERHEEHPDGNWTWIGKSADGSTSIVTFGERAVFGSISRSQGGELQLVTAGGRTWLVETDSAMLLASQQKEPSAPDYLAAPTVAPPMQGAQPMALSLAEAAPVMAAASVAAQTVDLLAGYSNEFATRHGGDSQARTRINFLVDLANQALVDSQVQGRVRLVHAMRVGHSDLSSNQTTLFQLTGVTCTTSNSGSVRLPDRGLNCTSAERPAALQTLAEAREEYGADLVTLIRTFQAPEQGSCGAAWLLGAGQTPITSSSAAFAFSVVSDSGGNQFPDEGSTCREDYLAHELGHNLGLQHDREVAAGSDDTNTDGNLLDPEEYGHLPYTFGHVAGADAGNFYTIMSIRRAGATGYRVYSNPRITICGGQPCGVANQADNALGLATTVPGIAAFRATVIPLGIPRHDFNGDGVSDLLWRNGNDGRGSIWLGADSASTAAVATVASQAWQIRGVGDFNGDGVSDLLWRNGADGRNSIWLSANSATPQAVSTVASQAWQIAGVGDFNGDGNSDLLWRNGTDGRNSIWLSANVATPMPVSTVANFAWHVAAVGDFNGDGSSDILWRNNSDGRNSIWFSANSATPQSVAAVGNTSWRVEGAGDFNGDGADDIVWRNSTDGRNSIWLSANAGTPQAVSSVASQAWQIAAIGDYNGDGVADLAWRNGSDGRNSIWLSANSASSQAVSTVSSFAWRIIE